MSDNKHLARAKALAALGMAKASENTLAVYLNDDERAYLTRLLHIEIAGAKRVQIEVGKMKRLRPSERAMALLVRSSRTLMLAPAIATKVAS
jgi:hypothetical protein